MNDKDTWIAENVFPKNTNIDKIRKPRLNVKSVDVSYATRKTKITFCVLGSWAIYMPPYNLARLSALTRESGYLTNVHDFNIQSYYDVKEVNPDLKGAWEGANYWMWREEYYTKIHPTYEPILKNYLDVILANDVDIIGFSTYYTNIFATIWMIDEIKKVRPNVTIILGGPECHDKNFKLPINADYYFIGESEHNVLEFLNNWEEGIKPAAPAIGSLYSDIRIDLDSLPYPDYSDFDLTQYWGNNSVCAEISRGCIAKCTYCTEVYYWKFRDRGAKNVLDEIEYQVKKYGVTHISFVDSLMNGNLKEFRSFCEGLVEKNLGITWWGYARCDGRMDLEFYKIIKAAGAQGFNYGIESGSDKVLKEVNKKNTVAEINQNIIDSHAVGLKVNACWVIGAPGEDIEAFTHSFNMLWNHRARIIAVSPGPGLGDTPGSDYDNRDKYNINLRGKEWLNGWYTLDLTNTKLHRYIRIKLMHIWLYICKEYGGTLTNIHSIGDISKHFDLKFDSEFINDNIEYENFDFNIINSGQGLFADSAMNEVFGFLRMLWRSRGGFEITLNFDPDLDQKDFVFAIDPSTHRYQSKIWFKIDDLGNYQIDSNFDFKNYDQTNIKIDTFNYKYSAFGQWDEIKKTISKKVFFIKVEPEDRSELPLASCFSGISIAERYLLLNVATKLPANGTVVEISSHLGGRAAIFAHGNKNISIHSFETFEFNVLKQHYEYMKDYVNQHLAYTSEQAGLSRYRSDEIIKNVLKDFDTDPTGKLVWEYNTKKYSNIHLHQLINFNTMPDWNKSIDVCLLNLYQNPEFNSNVTFWSQHIKAGGLLIAQPYNKDRHPEVVTEINKLIDLGWSISQQQDNMIVIQKPH
jgi:radical SAM superfamily enzyme YgiQ (UPF0313 family)